MIAWLLAVAGTAAGAAQARWLGAAARGGPGPLGLLARLGVVGAVLVIAARAGHLAPAAAGWGLGFAAAAAIVHRRLR